MGLFNKFLSLNLATLAICFTGAFQSAYAQIAELPDAQIEFTINKGDDPKRTETYSGNKRGVKLIVTSTKVISNAPIQSIEFCNSDVGGYDGLYNKIYLKSGSLIELDGSNDTEGSRAVVSLKKPYPFNVELKSNNLYHAKFFNVCKVTLAYDIFQFSDSLKAGTSVFALSLNSAQESITRFESNISKQDRRHLARLKSAIANTLKLITDEKGEPLLPVTDIRIQENMRIIMVLTTVLNEILTNYDDVESTKLAVENLRNLRSEIRKSYGWSSGLAGESSKSLGTLAMLIHLEVSELYMMQGAVGIESPVAFNRVLAAAGTMMVKTKASDAGDARALEFVEPFRAAWNGSDFQSALKKLINAPKDYQSQVQPKLKFLLTAIYSLADLTDGRSSADRLLIPEDAEKIERLK